MRIAVMGAGGIGGYLAARLGESGADVALIARGAHLEAIRAQGLRLQSPSGEVTVRIAASDDPATVRPVDMVLFAVKLYDTEEAGIACRPLLGPGTGVVTFQNGIDGPEVLSRILGPAHVVGGVAEVSAQIVEPGLIRQVTDYARFTFGELDGRRSDRVQALAETFEAASIDHRVSADIRLDLWRKMVFLSALSGLTTLTRTPIGPIVQDPETRALLRQAVEEADRVARAAGAALPEDFVEHVAAMIDRLPAGVKSSTLVDLERGRRLELPWLSGTIARLGRELGVPTPVHAFITIALKLHAGGSGSG